MNKIVCVVNDYEIFNKVVKNNENLTDCEIVSYDNTLENISITKRYNDFISHNIENKADSEASFWTIFIHQDFGFMENLNLVLEKLDTNCIYGAIGATMQNGVYLCEEDTMYFYPAIHGRILQGNNDFNFTEFGPILDEQKVVDSLDCCCIMIHSSLIKKYNLKFDENLNFHMYAEELCYRVKNEHEIKTKVVQMNCFHIGRGVLNDEFTDSVAYLKTKFNINRIPSTCRN